MIKRFPSKFGSFDENGNIVDDLSLTTKFTDIPRPDIIFKFFIGRLLKFSSCILTGIGHNGIVKLINYEKKKRED